MKKVICLIMSLLMAMGLLCACGAEKKEDGKTTKKPASNDGHEALTMTTCNVNYQPFIDALHKKYPEINIEFIPYEGYNQTGLIREQFETGMLPDIVNATYNQSAELQKANLLNLSSYEFVNNYSDSMLNFSNVDGAIYLLPSNYNVIGIYYNKTVLDKYHWELPTTFGEMVALAPQIEAEGLRPVVATMTLDGFPFADFFGFGNTFYFNTLEGTQWKEDFLAGKMTATGKLEPVIAYFQKWIDAGFIDPSDIANPDTPGQFNKGEAVFQICLGGVPKSADFDDVGHMEYGIMPWLPDEGGEPMLISNVNRYYALNKSLGDKGNEQKLEDALHVMEFLSTGEGQRMLDQSNNMISPLKTSEISEDNFYYPVKDIITAGNTVPLVYDGWDDLIIPMAQELYKLIRGEEDQAAVLSAFDSIRDEWLANGTPSLGTVPEFISIEDTARLDGIAFIKNTDADVSLITLMKFCGFENINRCGIGCGIYQGELINDRLRAFTPAKDYCIVEMTGAEIKERAEKGSDLFGNGNIYDYVMVTDNDMELEDGKTYKVMMAVEDAGEALAGTAASTYRPADMQDMIQSYIKSMDGTISADKIGW